MSSRLTQKTSSVTSEYKEYKFGVGAKFRKMFDKGWHVGNIVDVGVQGFENTYEVVYDDDDWEILAE